MKVKLFALLGVVLLVGMFVLFGAVSPAFAQGPTPNPNPAPYGQWGGWSMMGGYDWGYAPGQTITPTTSYGGYCGYGMRDGYGYGYAPNAPNGSTYDYRGWGPGGMMGGYGRGWR